MKWFGTDWGAPMCRECEHVPTPVGQACERCHEPFTETDNGFIIPIVDEHLIKEGAWHYECHVREVIGSVAHQLRQCSCFIPGASESDPPELTPRQAARLAVELWEKNMRQM